MIIVIVEKHDVYTDGKPNKAIVRSEKFKFKKKKHALKFIRAVSKEAGLVSTKVY